jgi:DNA mismatch repair protein MutL
VVGKIKLLAEDTIAKIAAGEVVDRPASVVKELVENSIDALADSIEVEIDRSGKSLIRVADNGSGMDADDAVMAFKRHATSKIREVEDLEKIMTLGFRGEALASIASVSQVDVTTRRESDATGAYMYLESGTVQRTRPAARDRGTTIEVRNLFYNVPARKKFLKKESSEMAEIISVFSRFVLSRPEIAFRLTHGGRTVMDVPPGLDIKGRIGIVLGEDVPRGMMDVSCAAGEIGIGGFASMPSFTRKDKKAQMFFVNGRAVRSKVLSNALYGAYRSLLERGRYPMGVIFVSIPPDSIDVNVHPSKLDIKFDDDSFVREALNSAIEDGFKKIKREGSPSVFQNPSPGEASSFSEDSEEEIDVAVLRPASGDQEEFNYGPKEEALPAFSRTQPEGLNASGMMLQLGDSYIVKVTDKSLIIIDQHAAHERVLYEYFSKTLNGGGAERQGLLFPLKVDLTAEEAAVMQQMIPGLSALGFEIDGFGGQSFLVRSVPAIIRSRCVETVIKDMVSDLSEFGSGKMEYMDELVKLVSCRSAVKASDKMNRDEMEGLLDQLDKCDLPFTCPHGRPTKIEISMNELEKRFRRT